MTDRAQPGAIKSLTRNDELAQVFGQFSDGWVVPGDDPTPAAQRRADIDETAFDAFALSTSSSSLTVTVAPGEAFVGGWCARDTKADVDLPANSITEIVVAQDVDAVYDPDTDTDRDAADRVLVDTKANVSDTIPQVVIWTVETDGSGVTATTDEREIGPTALLQRLVADVIDAEVVNADALEATSQLTIPVYSDDANAPNNTNYYNDTDNIVKYKDSGGTVREPVTQDAVDQTSIKFAVGL